MLVNIRAVIIFPPIDEKFAVHLSQSLKERGDVLVLPHDYSFGHIEYPELYFKELPDAYYLVLISKNSGYSKAYLDIVRGIQDKIDNILYIHIDNLLIKEEIARLIDNKLILEYSSEVILPISNILKGVDVQKASLCWKTTNDLKEAPKKYEKESQRSGSTEKSPTSDNTTPVSSADSFKTSIQSSGTCEPISAENELEDSIKVSNTQQQVHTPSLSINEIERGEKNVGTIRTPSDNSGNLPNDTQVAPQIDHPTILDDKGSQEGEAPESNNVNESNTQQQVKTLSLSNNEIEGGEKKLGTIRTPSDNSANLPNDTEVTPQIDHPTILDDTGSQEEEALEANKVNKSANTQDETDGQYSSEYNNVDNNSSSEYSFEEPHGKKKRFVYVIGLIIGLIAIGGGVVYWRTVIIPRKDEQKRLALIEQREYEMAQSFNDESYDEEEPIIDSEYEEEDLQVEEWFSEFPSASSLLSSDVYDNYSSYLTDETLGDDWTSNEVIRQAIEDNSIVFEIFATGSIKENPVKFYAVRLKDGRILGRYKHSNGTKLDINGVEDCEGNLVLKLGHKSATSYWVLHKKYTEDGGKTTIYSGSWGKANSESNLRCEFSAPSIIKEVTVEGNVIAGEKEYPFVIEYLQDGDIIKNATYSNTNYNTKTLMETALIKNGEYIFSSTLGGEEFIIRYSATTGKGTMRHGSNTATIYMKI